MTYTPKTWADGSSGGTPIDAASLNNIESGIVAALTSVDAAATYQRIDYTGYRAINTAGTFSVAATDRHIQLGAGVAVTLAFDSASSTTGNKVTVHNFSTSSATLTTTTAFYFGVGVNIGTSFTLRAGETVTAVYDGSEWQVVADQSADLMRAWTAFTPTLTGATLSSANAAYKIVGKIMLIRAFIVTTASVTSFSFPLPASATLPAGSLAVLTGNASGTFVGAQISGAGVVSVSSTSQAGFVLNGTIEIA